MNRERIEAVSRLIQACNNVGAVYKEDRIVMADGTEIPFSEVNFTWRFEVGKERVFAPLGIRVKALQVALLEMHLKIIKEKID
jgi:hypothetical protein